MDKNKYPIAKNLQRDFPYILFKILAIISQIAKQSSRIV